MDQFAPPYRSSQPSIIARWALAAVTLLLPFQVLFAQVGTNYGFTSAGGAYTAITGGTQLWGGAFQFGTIDDDISGAQTIPPFNYAGTIYTQMFVSANGFLTFGSAPAGNNFTPLSSGAGYAGAIAAFGTDLQNTNAGFGFTQREVRWETVGSEIVVQWKGMRRKGVSNENFNFQIRLNTTTAAIRFVYGSLSGQWASTAFQPEAGLRGPNNIFPANVNNRAVGTGAENWANSLAGTANNSTLRFTTSAPAKAFTNGLVYSFIPNCTAPSATASAITDCITSTYTVQVNVTGIGNAANVDVVSSVSGVIADNVGTGTYTTPAIANGTAQTLTVVHNGNSLCNATLGLFQGPTCFTNGACVSSGPAIPDNGCATNNILEVGVQLSGLPTALNSTAFFESVDLIVAHTWRGDLNISLVSPTGQSRNLCLQRPTSYADGNNLGNVNSCPNTVLKLKAGGAALSTMNAGTNNAAVGTFAPEQALAGYTGNPNGVWRLRICDAAGSDVGNLRHVKLNFLDCVPPLATASVVEDCANGVFRVSVNVTSTGSGGTVDLFSTILGLEQDNVGIGTYLLGPYPSGTPVSISVRHASNGNCDKAFNNLVDCCGGVCGSARNAVIGNNSTPTINCGDGASTGGGTRDARWFRWTAPYSGTINITACGGTPVVDTHLRLHSGACGGLTFLQQDDDGCTGNAGFSRILNRPVAAGTTYFIEWDNRFSSTGFTWQLQYAVTGSTNPCSALNIACGQDYTANSTAGAPNTLPSTACPFNGAASTGGTHWWRYVASSSGEVQTSLCGTASFNTRLSVFDATASCSLPTCVAMNDDTPGCPGGSSQVRFMGTTGNTYLIAVHGSGAATGTYTLSLFCQGACVPATSNDQCSSSAGISTVLANGTGVPQTFDNTCAHVDAPTSVSGALPTMGLWYTFNSGPNTRHRLHLLTHAQNPVYGANGMSYALYTDACTGLGASGELVAVVNGSGITELPVLVPNTVYRLLAYNGGSVSETGTYGVLIDHPGINDAGVTAVTEPDDLVCGTTISPVVTLKNFGEATLTNVILEVRIDGNLVLSHPWSGSLAYNATQVVSLPAVTTPNGLRTITVTAVGPNGAPDEITTNSTGSNGYDASGQIAKVVVHTDGAGAETTWSIYDAFFFPVANGGPFTGQNNTTVTTTVCLPITFGNCYSLYLFDSAGDGLCCGDGQGYWELRNVNDDVLLRDRFTASVDGTRSPAVNPESPFYSLGHEFCLPSGPSNILANECGLFNNNLLNKVYTSVVPGALLYQFEFSQPDEGAIRRIAVPRNWVKFGEMVTSPLLPGVTYFTRVRVDQGAAGFADDRFGGGCEMGIDPVAVPGCTQLIDNPSLPTHSCGVTKSFGGSDKIWAVPVVGGTAYRFRFSNPGEGYNRIIQSTNYVCILNWVTQPLVNGQYQVTVSVLVNGQWSGYCGAACTLTILNTPSEGSQEGRAMEVVHEEAEVSLYPNPVTDGVVRVHLTGLVEEVKEVLVDVYDPNGRKLMAERYTSDGERFEQVVRLSATMAEGVYIVNITAGAKVYTKRLIVR